MTKFIFCAVFDKYFLDSEAVALRTPAEKAILKNFVFVFCAVSQNPSGLSKYETHISARDCTSTYADIHISHWNLTRVYYNENPF